MKTEVAPTGTLQAGIADRRRHARYRFSSPIIVQASNQSPTRGMSIEISESGMSVLLAQSLPVGGTAELEPVGDGRVMAAIRRRTGKIYAFEFLNLTARQAKRIREICQYSPLFDARSLDI